MISLYDLLHCRVQNRILMSSGSNDSQEEIILTCENESENESAHSEDSGDNVHNIPYESAAKYQGACDRMVTGESTMVSHTECMMTSESLCHTDKSNPLAEWKRVTAARPAKYPTESKDTGYHSIGSTASQLGVVCGPLETRLHTHEEDLLEGPSLSMGPVRFTSLHEPDDFIGSASLPPSSTGCLAAPNSAEWASVASTYCSSVGYQTHTYHVGTLDPGGHKDEALDSGQLPEVLKVFSSCAP